jgi:6-phosphofructokinase
MKKRNAIVAQSGGPSPVINSSLLGVIDGCRDYPDRIGRLYAAWHGVEGILSEQLIDLYQQDPHELELLRTTTSAGAIGTCRYKLKADQSEDFERIVEVMRAHDVGWFFYIGGNDSMDTAQKVAELARRKNVDLVCTGVPKTIDNDVGDEGFTLIDHTPGYGSAARYWACITKDVDQENRGMSPSESVSVLQAMGRKAGFIPAAARLADPNREMPLQLYLVEGGHNLESMAENVNRELAKSGRCIVVVSEGFDAGALGEVKDSFGHVSFGASQQTVAQVVTNYLNSLKLPVPGKARFQIPGTDQRNAMIYASTVDMKEAYEVGRTCARIARDDGTGYMGTILREPGPAYKVRYDKVPLDVIANSERTFPAQWIAPSRIDVTDEFVAYAKPLIGTEWPTIPLVDGLQRFTRFAPIFADKNLDAYTPQGYR